MELQNVLTFLSIAAELAASLDRFTRIVETLYPAIAHRLAPPPITLPPASTELPSVGPT